MSLRKICDRNMGDWVSFWGTKQVSKSSDYVHSICIYQLLLFNTTQCNTVISDSFTLFKRHRIKDFIETVSDNLQKAEKKSPFLAVCHYQHQLFMTWVGRVTFISDHSFMVDLFSLVDSFCVTFCPLQNWTFIKMEPPSFNTKAENEFIQSPKASPETFY